MLSIGFKRIIRPGAPKTPQQSNPPSSKDNDDGEDKHLVTHPQFNTGVARQQLRDGHVIHHGPASLSLAASADNGRTCIVPDDNGTKTTAKIKDDNHDETDDKQCTDNELLTRDFDHTSSPIVRENLLATASLRRSSMPSLSSIGDKNIIIQALSLETTATLAITNLILITAIPSAQPPRVHNLLGCQIQMQADC